MNINPTHYHWKVMINVYYTIAFFSGQENIAVVYQFKVVFSLKNLKNTNLKRINKFISL